MAQCAAAETASFAILVRWVYSRSSRVNILAVVQSLIWFLSLNAWGLLTPALSVCQLLHPAQPALKPQLCGCMDANVRIYGIPEQKFRCGECQTGYQLPRRNCAMLFLSRHVFTHKSHDHWLMSCTCALCSKLLFLFIFTFDDVKQYSKSQTAIICQIAMP